MNPEQSRSAITVQLETVLSSTSISPATGDTVGQLVGNHLAYPTLKLLSEAFLGAGAKSSVALRPTEP